MAKALGFAIWENQAAFDSWVAAVDEALGYPDPESKTSTYTRGIKHQDSPADLRIMAGIGSDCPDIPGEIFAVDAISELGWPQ